MSKAKKKFVDFPNLKLGILGGGQLARMLALRAHELGVQVWIFSEHSDDPAAQVTNKHFKASLKDEKKLTEFLKFCDVVTFESEFLDGLLLSELSLDTGTPIFPDPEMMDQLSDRLSQKQLLLENKLPTSAFVPVSHPKDLEVAFQNLGSKIVLKKRRFGYDGYGTFFLDVKKSSKLQINDIFNKQDRDGFIAEEHIVFRRELALVVGRDLFGDFFHYPLVESKQTNAKCDWIYGPVKHKKLPKLVKKLKDFLNNIHYVGVMGVEGFDTGKDLILNEIAPRVHNTGHYTQNVFYPDQFTAHILCVIGQKIEKLQCLSKGFAMGNLLGQSTKSSIEWRTDIELPMHWYAKSESRPGRKMGHINAFDKNPKRALAKVLKERKKVLL